MTEPNLMDEPIPRFPMLGVLALLLVVEIVGFIGLVLFA
jgi:hypothetical protein